MDTRMQCSGLVLGRFALALNAAACGSDAVSPVGDANEGSAACPSLGGVWKITMHCNTGLVGSQVTIAQDACAFSTNDTLGSFTGTVQGDGSFMMHGSASGMNMTCGGVVTPKTITETCSSDCVITLKR